MVYIILLLLLFVCSMGYFSFCAHWLKLQSCFVPVVVFSTITMIVFVGGLLGILQPLSSVLLVLGFVLFAVALVHKPQRNEVKALITSAPLLFFFFISFVNGLMFAQATLGHYDDFSHWGTIVRDICESNAFPTDVSRVGIVELFVTYAPISSSFVYWGTQLLGYTEGHAIVLQNMLTLSALTTLFYAHGNKKAQTCMAALIAISMMCLIVNDNGSFQFQSLLIDTLIGSFALAATLILFAYKENPLKGMFFILPLGMELILIKENGKIYFAVLVLLTIILIAMNKNEKRTVQQNRFQRIKHIALALIVFAAVYVVATNTWKMHVDASFAAGYQSGKFAVTLDSLRENYVGGRALLSAFVAICNECLVSNIRYGVAVVLITLVGGGVLCCKHKTHECEKSQQRVFVLSTLISYGVIVGTMVALAIFYTMVLSADEVAGGTLSATGRYFGSAMVLFCGLMCWVLTLSPTTLSPTPSLAASSEAVPFAPFSSAKSRFRKNKRTPKAYLQGAFVACGCLLVFLGCSGAAFVAQGIGGEHLQPSFVFEKKFDHNRVQISPALQEASQVIPKGEEIALYYGGNSNSVSYRYWLSIYELNGYTALYSANSSEDELSNIAQSATWLVVVGKDNAPSEVSQLLSYCDSFIEECAPDVYTIVSAVA